MWLKFNCESILTAFAFLFGASNEYNQVCLCLWAWTFPLKTYVDYDHEHDLAIAGKTYIVLLKSKIELFSWPKGFKGP